MATWQERCQLRGGVPTVFPEQAGSDLAGNPACRYEPDNSAGQGGVPAGLYVYVDERTVQERLDDMGSVINDTFDLSLGQVVDARDSFVGRVEDAAAKVGDSVKGILSGTLSVLLLATALGFGIYYAVRHGGRE